MPGLDTQALKHHMQAQADAGMPLLSGCPSTAATRACDFIDSLHPKDRVILAGCLAGIHDTITPEAPDSPGDVIADYFEATRFRGFGHGLRATPVKLLEGISRDEGIGGLKGWLKQLGFSGDTLVPPPALASGPKALVPIAPRLLRSLLKASFSDALGASETKVDTETTRYDGRAGDVGVRVDIRFARGGPADPKQLTYHVWLSRGGERIGPIDYERLWRIVANWDYITEENGERSARHLALLATTLAGMVAE